MPGRKELRNAVGMWLGIVVVLFIATKLNHVGYDDGFPPRVDYGHVIGIDLGRHYSRVGIVKGYSFQAISDEQGRTAIPNYVAFPRVETHLGSPIVGFEAKEQAASNPENTFYDFRRLMGRNSTHPEVQRAIKALPYTILEGYDESPIRVGVNKDYTAYLPEEFTAMILEKLKGMAESHLNTTVKNAVITVPYEFDEQQRNATIEAAKLAQLNVLKLLDEPTAIALAYRLDTTYCDGKGEVIDCRYIIYEHDGTAPQLTLMKTGKGEFGVLGTVFDDHENDPRSSLWASLLRQVSLTKSKPSTAESQSKRILELVGRLLAVSNKEKRDIDGLIIITRDPEHIRTVQETLEGYFPGKNTVKPYDDFTPDQAIVCGASTLADNMNMADSEPYFMDVILLSLGIETSNGSFLRILKRNTITPSRKIAVVYMTANNQSNISLPIYEGEHELASRNHHLGDIAIELSDLSEVVQEKWKAEHDVQGKVEIELHFEYDPREELSVWVRKGGENVQGFKSPVMAKQWRWREVGDIEKEAEEAREEDLRVLAEGGIVGVGGIEVKENGG